MDYHTNYRCHGMDRSLSRVLDHQLHTRLLREVVAPWLCTMTDSNLAIPDHRWCQHTMTRLWKMKMGSSKGLVMIGRWKHPPGMGDSRSLNLKLKLNQHQWKHQLFSEGPADIGQPPPAYYQDQEDSYKTTICPSRTIELPKTRWGGM